MGDKFRQIHYFTILLLHFFLILLPAKIASCYTIDYSYDLAGNRTSRTVTVAGQELTTTYTYDPCTDRLLTEVHDGPELAFYWHDQPVYAYATGGNITHYRIHGSTENIGQFKALFMGMPSIWSQWLIRTGGVSPRN